MSFDHEYYKRFYYDPNTAVTSKREIQARARLIAAYALHTGLPVRRILDAGCGTGLLRPWLKRYLPRAVYTGIEASEYLCQRYGWQQTQIETYKPAAPFDVVVCYDVLQYLDSKTADRALANFGKLCRGVLYFTALTRVDWEHNCDRSRTDSNVHLRSANWYRSRLKTNFREAGCGFWLRRGAPFTVWDLESL
ncbi:MAG: class I SAM-dependent methyltransferase [Steroidobacteraceae bacterium]